MKTDPTAPPGGSAEGREVLYGLHAVQEALRAGARPIVRLLVARKEGQFAEAVHLARAANIPVHVEPRSRLDRWVPSGKHQGIVGIVGARGYSDYDEILAYARARQEPAFVVILDGIEDPQNLGAVLRTAEAAGVHGVFIPERRAVGLTAAVAKSSAGAIEHLRVACTPNLARLVETLKTAGLWVYGLDHRAAKPYTALDLRQPTALVFGSEGKGVRQGLLAKCDEQAGIPMRGRLSSLNVSSAAGIVLYEVVRQRTG